MRTLLRLLFLRRLLEQSRRHRRHGPWGYGYRRRPTYGWGYGRPRGRGQVRVTGCCLPIPLGMLTIGTLMARLGLTRLRR